MMRPETNAHRYQIVLGAVFCYVCAFILWSPLMLLGPGLLGFAVRGCSWKDSLKMCLLFGMSLSAIFQFWVFAFNILPWFCLILVRGIPWLFFGLVARFEKGIPGLLVGPALFLTSVVLLFGPTGNDWEQAAAAFAPHPWTLTLLPWLGVTGYSLVVGLLSGLLCSGERKSMLAGVLLACILAVASYSLYPQEPVLNQNRLALVQSGWTQDEKWDKRLVESIVARLFELTELGAQEGVQLVAWPETAWPVRNLRRRPSDTRAIGKLARKLSIQILASSIEEEEQTWSNSVSQILPTGRFSQEYIKKRLAPFAEYLPGPEFLKKQLRKFELIDQISYFVPGENSAIFELNEERFGLLICYESMHPGPAEVMDPEVDFFVVVTNDAPLGSNFAKECHFRSAVLRAAQFRKPVYQASNTGITGIVSGRGDVLARTDWGVSGPGLLTENGFSSWKPKLQESDTSSSQ